MARRPTHGRLHRSGHAPGKLGGKRAHRQRSTLRRPPTPSLPAGPRCSPFPLADPYNQQPCTGTCARGINSERTNFGATRAPGSAVHQARPGRPRRAPQSRGGIPAGRVAPLVARGAPAAPSRGRGPGAQRGRDQRPAPRAGVRKSRMGEVPRARQVLTAPAFAPGTEQTRTQRAGLPSHEPAEPVTLTPQAVASALRDARRGGAPGPACGLST